MSDTKVVAAMQRQAAEAEVERLRLVAELEEMWFRATQAEAQLASVSGVTRLELVAAERAKREPLAALLKECMFHLLALHLRGESQTAGPLAARVGDALKAEVAS